MSNKSPQDIIDIDKRLEPWRVLRVGSRVRIQTGLYKDAEGVVIEKLDDSISGMARYHLEVDYGTPFVSEGARLDYCRYELRALRPVS